MPGRVPHPEVPRYYSLIDVAAFPRRPVRVCEVVPPLKPFEAMAMGKPVVAADVATLRQIVRDRATGLLFPSTDGQALAGALHEIAWKPELARTLGAQGRSFVLAERTWSAAAKRTGAAYAELLPTGQGSALVSALKAKAG